MHGSPVHLYTCVFGGGLILQGAEPPKKEEQPEEELPLEEAPVECLEE
jgi:hypothetical protein